MSAPLVLLVDPHDDSRAIYATILRHAGFGVASAAHADDGLTQARANPPDLVVLAMGPPRTGALGVLRVFRSDPATARVPVVALSTVPADGERDLLLAEGIAAYLEKPCSPLALLAEVQRLLTR